jgi:hypothetical protein
MARKNEEEIEQQPEEVYPTNPDESYDKAAVTLPVRDIELPPEPSLSTGNKSMSDRMAEMGDLTDMQAILLRLFPDYADPVANLMMVGRIHPDVFLPWIDIMSTNEIMLCDPSKPIDVAATRNKYYNIASIGLDGKGRIDALEIGGAAREQKNLEKSFKGIGSL